MLVTESVHFVYLFFLVLLNFLHFSDRLNKCTHKTMINPIPNIKSLLKYYAKILKQLLSLHLISSVNVSVNIFSIDLMERISDFLFQVF